jgi:hypothetical protein
MGGGWGDRCELWVHPPDLKEAPLTKEQVMNECMRCGGRRRGSRTVWVATIILKISL